MELTKKQAITEHKKMWNWIADEIERLKVVIDIFNYKKEYCYRHNYDIDEYCFCCEYSRSKVKVDNDKCINCPIDWGSKSKRYMCQDMIFDYDNQGIYSYCIEATTWQEQAKLARQIANLPERR